MKAILQPIYLKSGLNEDYKKQLNKMKNLLHDVANFLEPVALEENYGDADAIVFLQLTTDAYKQFKDIKKIDRPILILTSEFGTMAMWDWEIVSYFRDRGLDIYAPYDINISEALCRALSLKRSMIGKKFLVFQDNPGEGFQADIFKRFFWWEDECIDGLKKKFGIEVVKKSFKTLGEYAKKIDDRKVEAVVNKSKLVTDNLGWQRLSSAVKMYIAIREEVEKDNDIIGVGINCLNESHFSDTTPCLAFNLLYQKKGIIWGCEADIMSMMTEYIINKTTLSPVMMSNVYPFLMGQNALKHEKIESFPKRENPQNHILVAHCGYFGLIPPIDAETWILRPKVLEIVDNNAIAVDARYKPGYITFAKINSKFDKMLIVEGFLDGYEQFPGSDCRNGGVIRVKNGYEVIEKLFSHHVIFTPGRQAEKLEVVTKIMGMKYEIL